MTQKQHTVGKVIEKLDRPFRLLAVIGATTRECLAIEEARSLTVQDVNGVLQSLFTVCGTLQHIRSDNGLKSIAKIVRH